MKIKFHEHTSIHNCDDCGIIVHSIYTVKCKGYNKTFGDEADCHDEEYYSESGDMEDVLTDLFEHLKTLGYDVKLPENDLTYKNHDTVVKYDRFVYGNGFILYLHNMGIDVKTTSSTDEHPDDDEEIKFESI